MKKLLLIASAAILAFGASAAGAAKYVYDTVPGDPMKVKMYTLPNGLKIYMSVNKDRPRIQTNIAVRVGGKNDPAETTGLAHYFEHLMFKGTPNFGTTDYAAEKPMLDQIEQLFEVYRQTTDSASRAAIYHTIDSISYEASKLAIPNEYDKLMSAIGASGTNAYTSTDETCYVEDIPSNQIENWARIQAERFRNPVLRGFHTELETIYEEKNMSLTDDQDKAIERMLALLFPNHPYGSQTVLGSQEHLKNPSITNVKNYHKQWYVPNNMAIVVSGDFDPDYMVDVITRYFGDMTPNPDLKRLEVKPEDPITEPKVAEVTGLEAETLYMGWWAPAAKHHDIEVLQLADMVLSNGRTGLIDLNINHKQTMLGASAFLYSMPDQSAYLLIAQPKEGQTLDEVRDLLLEEIRKLRDGEFDEAILPAIINNFKRNLQASLEGNGNRVDDMVNSFINGTDWADEVQAISRFEAMTKDDVVRVARKYLGPDNYAIVYKRQGKDESISKINKPALTPIATNRDAASAFLEEIQATTVEPIEPVFVDYERDLTFAKAKNDTQVLYKHNDTNSLFSLVYVIETGSYADLDLPYIEYADLLGTPTMTSEEIRNKFYELACDYSVSVGARRSYITLTGLAENMPQAMALMEDLIRNAVPDAETWSAFADRLIKSRNDAKADQRSNFTNLYYYAAYGPEFIDYGYSNEELTRLDPKKITDALRGLMDYEHRIIYYGPDQLDTLIATLNDGHYMPQQFTPLPKLREFPMKETPQTVIYIAPYDSNQIYMRMLSNNGEKFDRTTEPLRSLYNSYFGGDMSSIVFQEMRESRSLAYSASAGYNGPSRPDEPYYYTAFIATQNDKMMDAINAFNQIINDMPQSEKAFRLSKEGIEAKLRTARTIKGNVAWSWINSQDMGYDTPAQKVLYEALPGMTLDDVVAYQQQKVKDRTYVYCILGRIEDLDLDALRALGRVEILTPEQIFGY